MDQAKRKRLKAKGWHVGSAADFLGLSKEEEIYVEMRLRLSRALRIKRETSKLSQMAVAEKIGSSQSRVAKMEAGDESVSLDLLIRTLIDLGEDRKAVARIIGA